MLWRFAGQNVGDGARARSCKALRSLPETLTPTSERMPIVSMLMIGCVQMFDTPGSVVA
jgi:hypothetical protein